MTDIRQMIPDRLAYMAASPFFQLTAALMSGDGYPIHYQGHGAFGYLDTLPERQAGQLEAFLSLIPVAYGLIPVVFVVSVDPLPEPQNFALTMVLTLYSLLLTGVVGEVSIDIMGGDSDE